MFTLSELQEKLELHGLKLDESAHYYRHLGTDYKLQRYFFEEIGFCLAIIVFPTCWGRVPDQKAQLRVWDRCSEKWCEYIYSFRQLELWKEYQIEMNRRDIKRITTLYPIFNEESKYVSKI